MQIFNDWPWLSPTSFEASSPSSYLDWHCECLKWGVVVPREKLRNELSLHQVQLKVATMGNHSWWRCAHNCYVLNAVFAFVFIPSPLKRIKCNEQRLNSVILQSQTNVLFVISLNFLQWNLLKFSQHIASSGIRILNTKKVGFVKAAVFANYVVYRCEKILSCRFLWNSSSDLSKIFNISCQI